MDTLEDGLIIGFLSFRVVSTEARDFVILSPSDLEQRMDCALNPRGIAMSFLASSQDDLIRYQLGSEARKVINEPNAGGSSWISEALSVEVLNRCLGACDVVTEMQVEYFFSNCKKVDYVARLPGRSGRRSDRCGVSVTRAMGFPSESNFSLEDANHLLLKKLQGLVVARSCISEAHSFTQSLLHVWCASNRIAELVRQAAETMLSDFPGGESIVVWILVAHQAQSAVFQNRSSPP